MNPSILQERAMFPRSRNARYHFDYLPLYENPDVFNFLTLYQAGDIYPSQGYRIGHHVQYYHEVSYIESGCGKYCVNGVWFPVTKGDIILTRRGDTHDGVTDGADPMRTFYLGFDIQDGVREQAPYCDILALYEQPNRKELVSRNHPEIVPFFLGIFQELVNRRHLCGNFIESYALQLLLSVYRAFCDDDLIRYSPVREADFKGRLVHEIIRYIDANVERIDSLSELVGEFGYSYSHLAHLFKEQVGMSLFQYYDKKRFDRAAELLRDDGLLITDIAEHLKYQSLHAFSKAFSKRFGVSPSEYAHMYKVSAGHDPFFEQGRELLRGGYEPDEDIPGPEAIQGNLFYCAGSCITRIPDASAQEEAPPSGQPHRLGHVPSDLGSF